MKLSGKIEKIIYKNDDGYLVGVLDNGEKIAGVYYESDVEHIKGASVELEGEFVYDKYGKTFKFDEIKVTNDELFFFLDKVVKGFTKKLIADVIEHFGKENLVDILENDIERLKEVKGIKEKRLEKIKESWKKFKSLREIGEFLAPLDVSPSLITLIATSLKDTTEPCKKIKNNPYILTNIKGIGFKRADEIALKMGIKQDDQNRIKSAIDYAINNFCEANGNSCIKKDVLYKELDELLEFKDKDSLYESVILDMVIDDEIKELDKDVLAPKRLYEAESFLLKSFKKRVKQKGEVIVKDLDEYLKNSPLKLSDEQKEAVRVINEGSKLLFLVGYAGTGKSTVSKIILELLSIKHQTVTTCALSGIASQRIAERSGFGGGTIQSLLSKYEDKDYFPFDVVLIDEASMINSVLFATVVSKVKDDAVLIIVGDDAQLPPIGAGDVLSDMIKLNFAPIVKLTKIYRQNENQAIAVLANEIRKAKVPPYHQKYDDFRFIDVSIPNYFALKNSLSSEELKQIREDNHQNIIVHILNLLKENLNDARAFLKDKKIKEYINHFQVITPIKAGTLGVENLNKILQNYFNPNPKNCIQKGENEFRLMDKVVHIKNENMPTWSVLEYKEGEESFKRRVYNGMCGVVFKIDKDEEILHVFYPVEDMVVEYSFDEAFLYLNLSYALTIHKTQGMEYNTVVIPMTFSHYMMLNTKLIYTAITRAKNMCYIIGEAKAFEAGCKRLDSIKRDTVMMRIGNEDKTV